MSRESNVERMYRKSSVIIPVNRHLGPLNGPLKYQRLIIRFQQATNIANCSETIERCLTLLNVTPLPATSFTYVSRHRHETHTLY